MCHVKYRNPYGMMDTCGVKYRHEKEYSKTIWNGSQGEGERVRDQAGILLRRVLYKLEGTRNCAWWASQFERIDGLDGCRIGERDSGKNSLRTHSPLLPFVRYWGQLVPVHGCWWCFVTVTYFPKITLQRVGPTHTVCLSQDVHHQ